MAVRERLRDVMAASMHNRARATSDERFARVCLKPAKAILEPIQEQESNEEALMFECIEATQRTFKKSDKEMSALLKISQPNYARRKYNVARIHLLDLDMRRVFAKLFAKMQGLEADAPRPQEQLKAAAKDAILSLLDLMEAI